MIWKSTYIFAFTKKWYAEGFALYNSWLLEIFAPKIYEMFVYKQAETIYYIEK